MCAENIFLCKYKHKKPQWRWKTVFLSSGNGVCCSYCSKNKSKASATLFIAAQRQVHPASASCPGECGWSASADSAAMCLFVLRLWEQAVIRSQLRLGWQNQNGEKEIELDACRRFFTISILFVFNITNLAWSDVSKCGRTGRNSGALMVVFCIWHHTLCVLVFPRNRLHTAVFPVNNESVNCF